MPSLRDDTAREILIKRLQGLTPGTKPKWGKLDAARMLSHLGDALAMALGAIPVEPMNRKVFQHFPLKHLILYVLPFPKSAATARELLSTPPKDFDSDRRRVVELMHRLAATPDIEGPEHFLFGPLSYREWNALQWKHVNHHLQQFGC
jgi:hypothetical protein